MWISRFRLRNFHDKSLSRGQKLSWRASEEQVPLVQRKIPIRCTLTLTSPTSSLTGKWRDELAGGEVVQGTEAAGQLIEAQAALAVEPAQKLLGGALRLVGVAIEAARDEVAEGIAAEVRLRDDVVEAPSLGNEPAQTIEAAAAFAGVDGAAERTGLEEIGLREAGTAGSSGGAAGCGFGSAHSANFLGQPHTNDVVGLATALDQAQHAARNQAPHRLASGLLRETNTAGKPGHRKAETALAFEAAVAEKMRVDGAVDHGKV